MLSIVRVAGLLAVAGLLFLGAAGLSGHIVVDDLCGDFGSRVEGSSAWGENRWGPPGIQCYFSSPSGAVELGERSGSWPGFLGVLLVSAGLVGLALRRRPEVPVWLRVTAATTLTFAVTGVGAYVGGFQGSVLLMLYIGLPVAVAADVWLARGRADGAPWGVGFAGAAVAFAASCVGAVGYLYGFDAAAAYGVTLLLVPAAAALPVPWHRLERAFAR